MHAGMCDTGADTLTASQYLQCPAGAQDVGHEHVNALDGRTLRVLEILFGQRRHRYDQAHDRAQEHRPSEQVLRSESLGHTPGWHLGNDVAVEEGTWRTIETVVKIRSLSWNFQS